MGPARAVPGKVMARQSAGLRSAMTKTENRAAARAYAAEKERRFQEEQAAAGRARPIWKLSGSFVTI
jgi:hypothetical protein